jgi:hypothetical protein
MKAHQIAALIDLVATECQRGNMSFEVHTDLNAALWSLAVERGIREDVHAILQEESEAEMSEAV